MARRPTLGAAAAAVAVNRRECSRAVLCCPCALPVCDCASADEWKQRNALTAPNMEEANRK
jgi:hypothetical protein